MADPLNRRSLLRQGDSANETHRWRVVIVPHTDTRPLHRSMWRPRKWHWKREWCASTGHWWTDCEGYTETLHSARRKSMASSWDLYTDGAKRLEIEFGIASRRSRSTPPMPGELTLEVIDA